jgi:hypothetical protein
MPSPGLKIRLGPPAQTRHLRPRFCPRPYRSRAPHSQRRAAQQRLSGSYIRVDHRAGNPQWRVCAQAPIRRTDLKPARCTLPYRHRARSFAPGNRAFRDAIAARPQRPFTAIPAWSETRLQAGLVQTPQRACPQLLRERVPVALANNYNVAATEIDICPTT